MPARVTVDGHTAVVTLHRDGQAYYAALSRRFRDAVGRVGHGARIVATIEVLKAPPPVEVPSDLAAALGAAPPAEAVFDSLTAAHRRHMVDWISEAKRPGMRARRITRMVGRLPRLRSGAGWTER